MLFRGEQPSLGSIVVTDVNSAPCATLQLAGSGDTSSFLTCLNSAAASKFSIDASGNTVVAGTLAVTGAITASSGISGGTAGVPALGAAITADGAIAPGTSAAYVITKSASAAVLTLAAPTATTDDGKVIVVSSFGSTARAHVTTVTGLCDGSNSGHNTITMAAVNGASFTLLAYQAKWLLLSSNGVTITTV